MPGFKYRQEHASFKSWLLQLTSWRIADQFNKRKREAAYGAGRERRARTETTEQVPDPASVNLEATWNEDWDINLMEAALDRVKKKADPKMYQIFDCYVLKRWPVSRVTEALQVSSARVYLTKHRMNRLIKREVAWLKANPVQES
jgi:RNA polymerase sigma-70 factor (ECF subfamily)